MSRCHGPCGGPSGPLGSGAPRFAKSQRIGVTPLYIGLEEQLEFSVNDSVMYVSLRILNEDIPELDKLILLQLYNASYHSSISDQSLLPIIVSANDD